MCTYGLEQWTQSQSAWFWAHQSLTNVVTAALLAFALAVRAIRGLPVLARPGREYGLIVGLTVLMLASLAWNYAPAEAWAEFVRSGPYYVVFVLLMPLAVADKDDLRAMLTTILLLGGALSLLLLATSRWSGRQVVMATGSVVSHEGMDRGNPLAVGTMGSMVAIVGLLVGFRRWPRPLVPAAFAVAFLGFAACIKSASRGQALAILVVAAIFLPLARRSRGFGGVVALGLTAALCVGVGAYVFDAVAVDARARLDSRWDVQSSIDAVRGGRLRPAAVMLSLYADGGPFRWVAGYGANASWGLPGLYFYPHVVPVEVLGELGLVGLVIFATLNVWCARDLRAAWPIARDDPDARGLLCAIGGLWLMAFLICWKEGSLFSSTELLGFAGVLGRFCAALRREAELAAEIDAAGYEMTDEELRLEEASLDERFQPAG